MVFLYGVIALFSVFGLCCFLRMIADSVLYEDRIVLAVEVRSTEDAEELETTLHQAAYGGRFGRRMRIVVLLAFELMDGRVGEGDRLLPDYRALLERYDAECYLIE